MNKRHINFYCNLSLLFFCNINGTQMQSLPSQSEKLSENDIQYVAKSIAACKKKNPYIINQIHILFEKIIVKPFLEI